MRYKMDKFITVDIEGDISTSKCHLDFTEDTLYRDPNTIMWVCSFYTGNEHIAYGIRLPSTPRQYFSPRYECWKSTEQYHEQTNVFPPNVKDYGSCINAEDYRKFLEAIANVINHCYDKGYKVYFKGYKEKGRRDAYDREIISSYMNKFNIDCHTECLIDVYDEFPGFWMNKTSPQKGQSTENQDWMNNGIRHNLEDSKNLWKAINIRKQPYRPITL